MMKKIVSGGQTGADRAALAWAIENGLEHGGWCPKGRKAADGIIPMCFDLQETESEGYRQRNKMNVATSDGTLIFNLGPLDGGTLATVRFAQLMKKPHHVCQLDEVEMTTSGAFVAEWLSREQLDVLNVAGPREEKRPGIGRLVWDFLDSVKESSKLMHSIVQKGPTL
jgi:hypothetical protein